MSNEFPEFVAGVQLHARAADDRKNTGNMGCPLRVHLRCAPILRVSLGHGMAARRLRAL